MLYNAIVISGPTGVGKTSLSIKLAKIFDAEIISCDSMQIYRGLDIGTAKIKKEEMEGIKHHLLDIKNPDEDYSVGEFEKNVNEILNSNKKTYILVGGTGLYISSITDGIAILPEKDDKLRDFLYNKDILELNDMLKKLDEVTYNKIDKSNKVRLVRAIEVCLITKRKFSEVINENIKNNKYKFLKIFLTRDREELYNIIDKRVDLMLEDGLIDEAFNVYKKYKSVKAIGYKELFEYFSGKITLEKAIDLLKQKSRNYAKRQITWFNNKLDYVKYNLSEKTQEEILNDILLKWKSEE